MSSAKSKLALSIRWALRQDTECVLRIDRASYQPAMSDEEYAAQVRDQDAYCLVADCEGEVVGYMMYRLQAGKIVLDRMAVEPVFRRMGVGSAMMHQLIVRLTPQRRSRVEATLSERNVPAQMFLSKLGFQAVSIIRDFVEDQHDAYLFEHAVD